MVAPGLSVNVNPESCVCPELQIWPEKLTCTAASPLAVTSWVPGKTALGKPVGTPQLFETVMLLVVGVEQLACAPDFAHTVPESLHAPGLVVGLTSALTVALFCTLVDVA